MSREMGDPTRPRRTESRQRTIPDIFRLGDRRRNNTYPQGPENIGAAQRWFERLYPSSRRQRETREQQTSEQQSDNQTPTSLRRRITGTLRRLTGPLQRDQDPNRPSLRRRITGTLRRWTAPLGRRQQDVAPTPDQNTDNQQPDTPITTPYRHLTDAEWNTMFDNFIRTGNENDLKQIRDAYIHLTEYVDEYAERADYRAAAQDLGLDYSDSRRARNDARTTLNTDNTETTRRAFVDAMRNMVNIANKTRERVVYTKDTSVSQVPIPEYPKEPNYEQQEGIPSLPIISQDSSSQAPPVIDISLNTTESILIPRLPSYEGGIVHSSTSFEWQDEDLDPHDEGEGSTRQPLSPEMHESFIRMTSGQNYQDIQRAREEARKRLLEKHKASTSQGQQENLSEGKDKHRDQDEDKSDPTSGSKV